ncbi:MAG: response regulator [Spirochaetes bacterium]|nr:response regulator [Spirochaetota bacterium]
MLIKRISTIGFFTPNLRFDIKVESELYSGIFSVINEKNANLITAIGNRINNMQDYYISDNLAYEHIKPGMIDGIIIWASNLLRNLKQEEQEQFYKKFSKIPIINIAHIFKGLPSVLIDNNEGICQIMDHLNKKHGVKKIAYINGPINHLYSVQRLEAFKNYCKNNNIELNPSAVSNPYNFSFLGGLNAMRDLLDYKNLKIKKDIEAVICCSDSMAGGVIMELTSRGIKIPNDVFVTGFDNSERSKSSLIPLTTVDTGFYKLGKKAAELIFDLLDKKEVPDISYTGVNIICRESCGCVEIQNELIKDHEINEIPVNIESVKINSTDQLKNKGKEFIKLLNDILPDKNLNFSSMMKLYHDFINNIYNKESNDFLINLVLLLNETKNNLTTVYFWQDIITLMRSVILPDLNEIEYLHRAEFLLHQARYQINRIETYIIEIKNVETREKITTISSISNNILTTFDLEDLLSKINNILNELKITGCYISVYEDANNPFRKSRLIYALSKNLIIYKNTEGYLFDTIELIPKDFIKDYNFKNLILLSLCFKNSPIGFIIFEIDTLTESHWSIIKDFLSNALQGYKIRIELEKSQKEREKLLLELESQNIMLERKVKERTADIEKVNDQLQFAIEEAQKANKAKSTFLANMSHEIRTPLNCIIGITEIIMNEKNKEEKKKFLKMIINESENLMTLINQILDLSKIEAGKLKLIIEKFNIYELINSLNIAYIIIAEKKGLKFSYKIDQKIPKMIIGDELRIRQVLINLIGNAIKFTEKGNIDLILECEEKDLDNITIVFKIKDTGIGIPEDKHDIVFRNFEQVKSEFTRKYSGTGLGTSISRQLVKLMGGEIGFESREGKGSTFWFKICFEISNETEVSDEEIDNKLLLSEKYKNFKILVVEDHELIRKIIKHHIEDIGCSIDFAENGKKGVELFKKNSYDLIFMDLQMPEMDGYKATRMIRSTKKNLKVPIIALTANVFEEEKRKCYKAGMNDIIIKPFKKKTLQEAVLKYCEKMSNN